MVCVEELCSIFKTLTPHKRIEMMCGLLQCCVPLELRFIGSYVENLGRKDFHYLREYELKANSCPEINKLFEASEDVIRHKLAVYLSLLHTSNSACSKLCFDLLNSLNTYWIPAYASPLTCKKANFDVMLELLTVLAMGINHPAFTFEQRIRLFDIYRWLEARAERLAPMSIDKDIPPGADPAYACVSPPESVFTSPDEPIVLIDPVFSPAVMPVLSRESPQEMGESLEPLTDPALNSPTQTHLNSHHETLHLLHSPNEPQSIHECRSSVISPEEVNWPYLEVGQSPSQHGQSKSPHQCDLQEKVFIKRVEVKGSDRKHEFRMEVTWSNGDTCEVYKSYRELYEFHTKLVQLFPEDASVHRQDRKLPFLSGNPHSCNREVQTSSTITSYFRKLVSLQSDILGCDHVIQFFRESPSQYPAPPCGPSTNDSGLTSGHSDTQITSSHNLNMLIISSRQSPPRELSIPSPLSPKRSPNQSSQTSCSPVSSQTSPNQSQFPSQSPFSPQMSPNQSMLPSDTQLSPQMSPHKSEMTESPLSAQPSPGQSQALSLSRISPEMRQNQSELLHPSPLSPQLSPNQSIQVKTSHTSRSPRAGRNQSKPIKTSRSPSPKESGRLPTIQELLEELQLSHHVDSFSKYTTRQLLSFTEEDFKALKLSSHAQKRLRTKLSNLSRKPKLPNGVTPDGIVHLGLAAQEDPPVADSSLPPSTLYTSTACIGHLTGSDAGNSSFECSPPVSPNQSNDSNSIVHSQQSKFTEEPRVNEAQLKKNFVPNTNKVVVREWTVLDVDTVGMTEPGSCDDRLTEKTSENSQFEPISKDEPTRGVSASRLLVMTGTKAPVTVQGTQSEEEDLPEQDIVPSQPQLSPDPSTLHNPTPTDIPHMYQSGYISDPTHSYHPRPAFPRMFPPMYPMGPPQPAHLPIHMYHKVTLPPDQIHAKMSGQYMQSYIQQPHSRSDTSSLPNSVMTVTVNSMAYNTPPSECPGHPHRTTSGSPAAMTSNSNPNRTVTLQNSVNPRFALSSSMNSGVPYSSIAPVGPPHVHRKAVSTQNSNGDSGMSSPATSMEGVGYVTPQQISTSVGSTPPYSQSTVQTPHPPHAASCSSCGCRGRCGVAPNYSAAYGGYVHTQVNMPPLVHIPAFLPPNSNGILPNPCLPPNCPIPFHNNPLHNVPNGIVPEQFSFHMSHAASHAPNLWNSMLYGYNSHGHSGGVRDNKSKPSCYNCGGAGHEAHDCRDTSMESASGQYSLNFKPDFPE